MKEFTFWYSETYTYKGWFVAESEEQARELLSEVQDGELDMSTLAKFGFKDKAYELEIDSASLEDVSE